MDEMTLLMQLRPDEPLASPSDLAAARTTLLAAAAATTAHVNRRRRLIVAGVGVGVAAAAAALVLLPSGTPPRKGAPPTHATMHAPSRAPTTIRVTPAAFVLANAAKFARPQTTPAPRAEQYYYVKDGIREAWFSVDGTHDGRLRFVADGEQIQLPGCVNGVRKVDGNPPTTEACSVDPAYLPNAPTTAAAWTTFLDKQFGSDLGAQEKGIVTTLADHYISPASQAALFGALGQRADLTLVDVAPVDGKPAVGVALPAAGGVRMMLLFAKTDNRFLGTDLRTSGGSGSGVGVTIGYGIVDQVGERP